MLECHRVSLALRVVKLPRPLGTGNLGILVRINADAIDFTEVFETEGARDHLDHDGVRTDMYRVLYPAVDQRHARVVHLGPVLQGEQPIVSPFSHSFDSAGEVHAPA